MKYFRPAKKKIKLLIIVSFAVLMSIIGYGFIDNDFEISKDLDVFVTLFKELNYNYVDEINPGELMETGINAMLKSLDPYTNFISESKLEDYKFMTTGQYGGIGALIHKKDDYIIISEPYYGFPAQKSDLRAGDIILKIDGKSAKGKSTSDISKILKGQPETNVKITIKRQGEPNPIEKALTREEIKINNIPYSGMLNNDIAYIKLSGFTINAAQEVKEAFLKLKKNNNVQALIFDLRGNGGGLLNESVNISNIFIKKGRLIVQTKGKLKGKNHSYKTIYDPVDLNIPLVILVDKGSASASEIVTGAMQDLDRAVIIGQKTFGKGLVQSVMPLSYNNKLKITVAKYYIPSGRCIQAIDYSHKDKNGKSEKIPDSLKNVFKTNNGRTVYSKGGIEPDIVVKTKQYANITKSLAYKHIIFDYATKFKIKNPSIDTAKKFQITNTIYNDFLSFLSDKDYDYTTISEKKLEELKKVTEKEKYFDDIKDEYQNLKDKLIHNKKEDLNKFSEEIKMLLKSEIVSRYYFQKGRIEASFFDDDEIKKAIEILNDTTTYKAILNGTDIQEK